MLKRNIPIHLVGSWSRPSWLSSPRIEDTRGPSEQFWRPAPEFLKEAQDDATRLAVLDQIAAGVDIVTDGEQRRQLFDRYFYGRLSGVDATHLALHTWGGPEASLANQSWRTVTPGLASQSGPPQMPSPRVVGPIAWPGPLAVDDFLFLDRLIHGTMPTKMTLSGPITALNRMADEWYHDRAQMGRDIADALNQEAHALVDAGCRILQFDEPEFRSAHLAVPQESRHLINRTLKGLKERGVTTYAHMCYGYANAVLQKSVNPDFYDALSLMAQTDIDGISIEYAQPGHTPEVLRAMGDKEVILGCINCSPDSAIETPEQVAEYLRGALSVIPASRLHASTDCGVWFLPRERALAKLASLVQGTQLVRQEQGLE